MNKKGIKAIAGLIAAVVIVTVFLSLNSIVSFFLPKEMKLKKINFEDYSVNTERAFALINDIEILNDDIRERINCSGWAFVETDENNEAKTGSLILKGRKNCYMTSELSFRRSSIQRDVRGWKKIQGTQNGYALMFSTVQLPNDVYEIYIYVEENENTRGITDTGAGFKKDGVNMESFTDVVFCDIPDIQEIEPGFDHGWWTFYEEDTHLLVQGWQIKEGIPSEELTYYAAFVGDNSEVLAFKMPSINHTSLGFDYGMEYVTSGFVGCVDYEQLPHSSGTRYILAEHEGNWYRTEASSYEIPGERFQ